MQSQEKKKRAARQSRHRRIRQRIQGTSSRPRLSVFRSHRYLSAQLIDDVKGGTLLSISEKQEKTLQASRRLDRSKELGKVLAERAKARGITAVVFDRSGYAYHGNIRAFAEGAREGGLQF